MSDLLHELHPQALRIAALLRARGEKVAVADGATGGLIAATLLTVRRGSTLTIRVPFGPNRQALAGPSGMVATRRWRARSAGPCGIPCSAK